MAGARLPTYDNNGQLDIGLGTFRPPSGAGDQALARGVNNLASGVEAWAEYTAQKDEKLEQFQAENQMLDLQQRTDAQINHNLQDITPDGKGFFQNNITKIQSDAQTTLDQIPENLRPQFAVRVHEFLNKTSDQLSQIEIGQGKKYIKDITTRKFDALTSNVENGFQDTASATRDLDAFLTHAALPPNQTAALRLDAMRGIEGGRLKYLATNNATQFQNDALKYMPAAPSESAGPNQTIAIQQSLAAGIDPKILLTIGGIESDWSADAKASKGTASGLYGITAAERSRLGLPLTGPIDPALQTAAAVRLTKENITTLQSNNLEVTPTNVWMLHFLGTSGGTAMLRAAPNADALEVYKSAGGSASAFDGRNGNLLRPGMTVGQVTAAIADTVSKKEQAATGYLKNGSADLEGKPLEIAGEKFTALGANDVGQYYGLASKVVNKNIDTTFDKLSKQALLTGDLNQYSSEGRKAIDKASLSIAEAYGNDDPAAIAQATGIIKQYGYLPTPIAQRAMQKLASGTPEQRAQAYDLLYTEHAQDPVRGLELSSVNSETKKRVEDYGALRGVYNMDPKEAAALADRVNSPEYKEKLAKVDADKIRQARASLSWSQIENKLNLDSGFLWWRDNTTPNGGPKQQIMARYADRFEYYYRESGDQKLAQAKAITDIARSHGVTSLTPERQFVLHPPENYYPPDANGSKKYFTEQLKGYVQSYVSDLATKANDPSLRDVDPKSIRIAGTSDTGNDIQAGRYPHYEVYYKDRHGDYQMIPTPFQANPAAGVGKFDGGRAAENNSEQTPSVDIAAARAERQRANEERRRNFRPRGNPIP